MRELISITNGVELTALAAAVERLEFWDRIDQISPGSTLMSFADAKKVMAQADSILTPCSEDVARKQATIMLAAFSGARPQEREEVGQARVARDIYVRSIVAALSQSSEAVAKAAVEDIVLHHKFGAPLAGHVTEAIEKIVKPIESARALARMHIRERRKRAFRKAQLRYELQPGEEIEQFCERVGL